MKKKIIKLSVETDFKLIGIATRISTHKLSWLLNNNLQTDFKQADDLFLNSTEAEKNNTYAIYAYDTNTELSYRLIENKTDSGTLIKQLKNIDYLLKIEGDFSENQQTQLIKKIRTFENIDACLIIDIQKLKQKEIELIS